MQPLLDRLGDGVFFSLLGCVSGVLGWSLIFIIRRYGMRWRGKREDRKALPEVGLEERMRGPDPGDSKVTETENCDNKLSKVSGKS
jgi:hypothetical protein